LVGKNSAPARSKKKTGESRAFKSSPFSLTVSGQGAPPEGEKLFYRFTYLPTGSSEHQGAAACIGHLHAINKCPHGNVNKS
jgi:hypothetical protein